MHNIVLLYAKSYRLSRAPLKIVQKSRAIFARLSYISVKLCFQASVFVRIKAHKYLLARRFFYGKALGNLFPCEIFYSDGFYVRRESPTPHRP